MICDGANASLGLAAADAAAAADMCVRWIRKCAHLAVHGIYDYAGGMHAMNIERERQTDRESTHVRCAGI